MTESPVEHPSNTPKTAVVKPEKATQQKPSWARPLLMALLALVWGVVAYFIANIIVGVLISFLPFIDATPFWTTILSAVIYILGLFLAIWVPGKLNKSWRVSRSDLGLDGLPTWLDIALAIAGYIIFALIAYALSQLFSMLFPWYDPNQSQDVGYNEIYNYLDRVIAFIALVVIAPIAEETLFRGWIYGKVRKYLPLIPAILLVSATFGLMHGQWNAGLTTFVLSIVLCSQREITGTIYSSIILHMLNNALAFYALYIA